MGNYKELLVWQKNQESILLASSLLDILPKKRSLEIICDQLFRAISSIGANIAEGQNAYEGKEFNRYCNIAIRSAFESDHWLVTLQKLNIAGESKQLAQTIQNLNEECIKMLVKLIKSLENKKLKTYDLQLTTNDLVG